MTKNNVIATFKIFDFDDDGFISAENLVNSFTNIGEQISIEEAKAIIKNHDSNNDLKISYEEFTSMLILNEQN